VGSERGRRDRGSTSTGSHETSVDVPQNVPALAHDTASTGTDDEVPGDVPLVAQASNEGVPLVAHDDEEDTDLILATKLDNRRYRWERRKHSRYFYWLLRTGRYYGKDRDTRETIYIGRHQDDPAGRARRRGIDVAAVKPA